MAKYGEKEYGPDGFYFQQRRAKLDLRSVSKLDLQKIVTEVDLESLQGQLENLAYGRLDEQDLRYMTDEHIIKLFRVSQLTVEYLLYAQEQLASSLHTLALKYAEKKKALGKKRNEIQLLQESEKQMKSQLKLKKMGIKTLENLIRDNASGKPSDTPVPEKPTAQANTIYPIKYFVSAANGICVEVESPSNMLIADVIVDIKKAFTSRNIDATGEVRPERTIGQGPEILRLVCRGKRLFEESTLAESGVISGDSLVAMFHDEEVTKPRRRRRARSDSGTESLSDSSTDRRRRRRERRPAPAPAATDPAILDAVNKQAQAMHQLAEELRNEQILRRQLSAQLEYFEQRQTAELQDGGEKCRRVVLQPGEIEDDFDGVLVSREEVANKLMLSKQQVDHLEGDYKVTEKSVHQFEYAIQRNSVDIEELKKQIYGLHAPPQQVIMMAPQPLAAPAPAPVAAPAPAPAPQTTVRVQKKQSPPKAAPAPAPVPVTAPVVVQAPSEPVKAPEPVLAPPVKAAPKPQTPPKVTKTKVTMPPTSTIEFTQELNRDLATFYKEHADVARSLNSTIALTITTDISFDELIFELRSAIAEKLDIALNRVALQLGDGQIFTLGMDAKTKFSPVDAGVMAAAGKLTVRLIQPMSDAQLDSMVYAMERLKPNARTTAAAAAAAVASGNSSKTAKQKYKRMVELLSDGDSDADTAARVRKAAPVTPDELNDFKSVLSSRESLDDTIRHIGDRDGLTDDELAHQRGIVSRTAAKLSAGSRTDIEALRSSIVSSMLDASAVDAEVDGELHHLSGSQSNWFDDGADSGSDTMVPKMHLKPTAKSDHETSRQIRESQVRQQMLRHQQDMLRARGLPPDLYDQLEPSPAAAVGIASVDVSDGQAGPGLYPEPDLNASLVNQGEESVLAEPTADMDAAATTAGGGVVTAPMADQSILAASTERFAPISAVDSSVDSDADAEIDSNLPGRLDFSASDDPNMSADESLTLASNLPSVTSTGSLGVAGRSRYGTSVEDEDDEELPAPTKKTQEPAVSAAKRAPTSTQALSGVQASHTTQVSSIEADSSLFLMKDSLNLTASTVAPEDTQRAPATTTGGEKDKPVPAQSKAKPSYLPAALDIAASSDSKASEDSANILRSVDQDEKDRRNHPMSANSWDESSQFDPNSTTGSENPNLGATDNSINNMYASADTTESAEAEDKGWGKGTRGDNKDSKGSKQQQSFDASSTGTQSLLNTAELLKYAGVDLGRTADSDVSSLGSSVTASQQAMAADINRENIIRKANEYEARAAERNKQNADRFVDGEMSFESKRSDKSFGRVSSPGAASSLFNDSTIHSNASADDSDNDDAGDNSHVMNFDSTLNSTLNSNADSMGDNSASTAGAGPTDRGASSSSGRAGSGAGISGIVGALQDDNDTIEDFDGPATTLSSGMGFGGSRGSTVSGVAQLSGSPSDLEDFDGRDGSPEFSHKSHGGLVQQPRGRGTTTPTSSRFSGSVNTPQSQNSRGGNHLTPAGASPFDHLSRPNNLTAGSLEHSLSIDDSANFDEAAAHPLHGGDSLALSDSENFGDLEDSAHSAYFAAPGQHNTPGGARKFK